MEPKTVLKPRLSIIVPAILGYDTALAALDSWDAQTCRDQLEILVLCPDADRAKPLSSDHVLIASAGTLLHQARAVAIRKASADFVMLAEDHCLPEPLSAEAFLARLEEGWDAVGPAMLRGIPDTNWTRAAFLIAYGQWMRPVASGPISILPGNNTVVRTARILELGDQLEREEIVNAFLLTELRRRGARFYLESQAVMRHFDPPGWRNTLRISGVIGLSCGARRTHRWPWPFRAFYWLGWPAVAALHWRRAWLQYRRAGRQAGMSPSCLALTGLAALVWACGESIGALMGIDRVAPVAWRSEIKPVSRSQAAAAGFMTATGTASSR